MMMHTTAIVVVVVVGDIVVLLFERVWCVVVLDNCIPTALPGVIVIVTSVVMVVLIPVELKWGMQGESMAINTEHCSWCCCYMIVLLVLLF